MRLLIIAAALLTLSSCSGRKDPVSTSSDPGKAALTYYGYLADKEYEQYVGAMLLGDSLPQSYRADMTAVIKCYVEREEREKGGIKDVTLSSVRKAADGNSAKVLLNIQFGDSIKEEVLLSLVQKDNRWFIR